MRPLDFTAHRRRVGMVGWFSIALAVLIAAALLVFWLFLADYQRSLPQNFADQILHAYQSGDVETIRSASVNLPAALEDPDVFSAYYEENADLGSLYFYPGASGVPEEACFEFAAGSDPVSTLTLEQTGSKSRFGFPLYRIKSITGYPLVQYRITAPDGVTVFADGSPLEERYRVGGQPAIGNFSTLTGSDFQTTAYEITDFFYVGELDAVSEDGCTCTVTWDEAHRSAQVEKWISEEEKREISDFAIQFASAYSVFATRQYGPRAPVMQMLYPGTALAHTLSLYNNDWGEVYISDRCENRVVDRLTRYSPTEFSCHIRFDYVITLADGFEKTYPYDMTYYLTRQGGRLLLVDMQAQEEPVSPSF